jgi:Spy/CpxP family protein refolding chaperone
MGYGQQMGGFGMKGMGGGMKMMFMKIPWMLMMHADELGISEEQIEALRTRHAEAKKQMIQIGSQIKMAMIDLKNAMMREEMNMPVAEAKAREMGKLKGDMFMAMIQGMHDMRQILTSDQQKKVKEMVMSWFKKGGMPGMGMEEGEEAEAGEMSEE